ncbi:MAG: 1-deoxy-D-xylulose-5-phosphate reductoisomerase, partial [Bacillota bacterium]
GVVKGLKSQLSEKDSKSEGMAELYGTEAAKWLSADLVIMAQVGFSGFEPLVAALKNDKIVALANKESLVIGGEILERKGLLDRKRLLPVDSEHSAIWQCIGSSSLEKVKKIYLTASGGPFYGRTRQELENVTPAKALKHPNWNMGNKITIDSATMMNKGLEVIEARWLFDLNLNQIEVVIHRQSIIHSMVEYIDGSILAQLGLPDMKGPIQYAITYPERCVNNFEKFNPFGRVLDFQKPDRENFPCLDLAFKASAAGGTMPAVLNGANEVAVKGFLQENIRFTDIPQVIKRVMNRHNLICEPEVEDVVDADRWSRLEASAVIGKLTGR